MAPDPRTQPIMLITHPRSCSTALKRILMTRRDILTCFNEPFADAFFNGPESPSERLRVGGKNVAVDGYENCTFKSIVDKIMSSDTAGRRVFVKEMAYQLQPPNDEIPSLAASFSAPAEPRNPTVLPQHSLKQFLWTFLIRHPAESVPSLYRLTIPPLSEQTGWHTFYPSEVGYKELRKLIEYLHEQGLVDKYCRTVGVEFRPGMLQWDTPSDDAHAKEVFTSWTGFHLDAIKSRGFKAKKVGKKELNRKEQDQAWAREFGEHAPSSFGRLPTRTWNVTSS